MLREGKKKKKNKNEVKKVTCCSLASVSIFEKTQMPLELCILHVISLKLGFQRGQQERNCKLRKIKYVYFTWVKIMCMSGTENTWSINLAMNRKWQTKELLKKQQNQKTTKTLSQHWKQVMKYNCAMRRSSS